MSSSRGEAQTPPLIPTPALAPTPVTIGAPTQPQQQQTLPGCQPAVPVPSTDTNVSVCGLALPAATGGQTITDPTGALRITLTEGGNYSYGPPRSDLGQPSLAVCHQQTNST